MNGRNSHYDAVMEELEDCLTSSTTIEEEIAERELTRIIESFLDSLSKENLVIFLRRYWFSDTYTDIAKQVGLTEKIFLFGSQESVKNYESIPGEKELIEMMGEIQSAKSA